MSKVKYKEQSFNIGRTAEELTFDDGRTAIQYHYGSISQTNGGTMDKETGDMTLDFIGEPRVNFSLPLAEAVIGCRQFYTPDVFDLDPKNPAQPVVGKLVSSKILDTVDFISKEDVAYLEAATG